MGQICLEYMKITDTQTSRKYFYMLQSTMRFTALLQFHRCFTEVLNLNYQIILIDHVPFTLQSRSECSRCAFSISSSQKQPLLTPSQKSKG